ncbi:MAG TPA: molybdopterin-dependent oxidoreductase, partial [Candidatus Limnocylindrales bacterium]
MTSITPARSRLRAAIAGADATIAALGAAELTSGLLSGQSLVAAVGGVVIDLQPAGAKDVVVALFATNDKLALELFIVGVAVAIGAALGVVALRSFLAGAGGIVAFAFAGLVAAMTDPSISPAIAALVAGVAAIVGVQALSWLLRGARVIGDATGDDVPRPEARAGMPDWSRRGFLLRSGSLAAASVVAGVAGRRLLDISRATPTTGGTVLPPPGETVVLPPGAELDVAGLTPLVVPNEDFYRIDTALVIPRVDVDSWELTIDGDVDSPFTIDFAELSSMDLVEKDITMCCVSNEVGGGYIGGARWLGVPVRELLERAGVRSGADQILSTSVDGMTISTPIQALTDDRDALVAIGMNGEPLPRRHGYPVRLVTPGLFGFVGSTKWLERLTATTYAEK